MSKPFVVINLDKPRTIKFTTNSLANLEELLNSSMFVFLQKFESGNMGIKEIRLMLWAGLQHEEKLSIEDIGNIMDEGDFTEICKKIGEGITNAFNNSSKKLQNQMVNNGTGEKHSEQQ